jgi:hypothetical protein
MDTGRGGRGEEDSVVGLVGSSVRCDRRRRQEDGYGRGRANLKQGYLGSSGRAVVLVEARRYVWERKRVQVCGRNGKTVGEKFKFVAHAPNQK